MSDMAALPALYDLRRLEQLYTAGFQDTFLDKALRKVITRQLDRDQADLQRVDEVLVQFERQYGLNSDEFWRQYQAGQMPDSADFMEWNVFYKMRQRIASRLKILQGGAM